MVSDAAGDGVGLGVGADRARSTDGTVVGGLAGGNVVGGLVAQGLAGWSATRWGSRHAWKRRIGGVGFGVVGLAVAEGLVCGGVCGGITGWEAGWWSSRWDDADGWAGRSQKIKQQRPSAWDAVVGCPMPTLAGGQGRQRGRPGGGDAWRLVRWGWRCGGGFSGGGVAEGGEAREGTMAT